MVRVDHLAKPSETSNHALLSPMPRRGRCAEENMVGIGGWVITQSAVAWFAEMWDISELRQTWRFPTKPAQAFFASFEKLAQFAFLQSTHHIIGHSHVQLHVPRRTQRLASTSSLRPSGRFAILKLIASWSHAHGKALMPSHIQAKRMSGQAN